ncbi:MAG: arylesterase [Desulfobacterales bacterium]|nr:MAG: arylesterase [Desulfobacterales bacterium]
MKKIVYILLGAVILFLGYRIILTSTPEQTHHPPDGPVICFGDSLTYGTGANEGMDYPSQLSRLIARPVINAGVPGDTTARALKRLERDVLSRTPAVVLITLGGNDLKNGVARATAFQNLKTIVETIQGQNAVAIIGGLRFPLRDRGYGRGFEELAQETGVILIPNILEDIMGDPRRMSDPIHPNDAGYKLIAERFHTAMPR